MRRRSVDRSALSFVVLISFVEGTYFQAQHVPAAASTVFWSDAAIPLSDGDGTDELENSSDDDDDWSDWVTEATTMSQSSLTVHSTAASRSSSLPTSQASVHTLPRDQANGTMEPVASERDNTYHSQPLKTLEKLQQMLDDTDYMTAAKPKQKLQGMNPVAREQSTGATKKTDLLSSVSDQANGPKAQLKSQSKVMTASASSEQGKEEHWKKTVPNSSISTQDDAYTRKPIVKLTDRLWQSKDRVRYKRQQQRLRRSLAAHEQASVPVQHTVLPRLFPSNPQLPNVATSDDEVSDDTDDGLGYSLPNLPVYYSDAEIDSEEQESEPLHQPATAASPPPASQGTADSLYRYERPPPPPPMHPLPGQSIHQYPPPTGYHVPFHGQHHSYTAPRDVHPVQPHDAYSQPILPYAQHYHPYPYPHGYPYPYHPFAPNSLAHPSMYPPTSSQHPSWPSSLHRGQAVEVRPQAKGPNADIDAKTEIRRPTSRMTPESPAATYHTEDASPPKSLTQQSMPLHTLNTQYPPYPGYFPLSLYSPEHSQSLAEASAKLSFGAIFKLSLLTVAVAVACYSGVSPRTLPLSEYNMQFYENIRLVSLSVIAPLLTVLFVFDARENDINSWINTFFVSYTFGYALTFGLEIISTTLVRLGVFHWLEPNVFSFLPSVPLPVLPWVLKDIGYRPKRITLFAADVATSCIVAPVVEEAVKLKLLEWTTNLPKNFKWTVRESKKSKRKRKVAEAIVRGHGEKDIINANKFVSQMLAVSLGLKLCDTGRRILMYTKSQHGNKSFYAFCRGIFPIHELCGTMTALALAKRDLLGVEYKTWQMLAPAVVIHAMANFRGMKPFYKWNSSTPWLEMQLSPVNVADPSTLFQLLKKGYAKMMWLVILGRVLGYCIKNYYMVNRQALKRTTTYAGKHAAFSAELATAEVLKKQKQN